jgi:DNA-binding NarL/FixJ family response regulator
MLSLHQRFPKIALAESDQEEASLLLLALRRAAPNLKVELLRDGQEVLNYFFATDRRAVGKPQAMACELLLLNLALPKLDGFKVLRQLQWLYREDLTQLPPVVVLCESDDPDIIAHAYRYGAKGFLCKVMTVNQLVNAIEQVLHYWLEVTLQPARDPGKEEHCLAGPVGQLEKQQKQRLLERPSVASSLLELVSGTRTARADIDPAGA